MIRTLEIVTCPVDVPRPTESDSRVQIWRDNSGTAVIYGCLVDETYWLWFPALATYWFRAGAADVKGVPEAGISTRLVLDTFYRNVLPMALQVDGMEVLHASGVQTPKGVAALCGRSETGKSTIGYGLSQRGYPLWSDDAVALEFDDSRVQVRPLPFNLRLRAPSVAYFGVQQASQFPVYDAFPENIDPQPLAAIVLLERLPLAHRARSIEVSRMPALAAFENVLVHACFTSLENRDRKQSMIRNYLALSAHTPVFSIRYPTGLEYLPQTLDRIENCFDEI